MDENIERFIRERFPDEDGWLTDDCYFFAVILQSVFDGCIVYDRKNGHVMLERDGHMYDWGGRVMEHGPVCSWDSLEGQGIQERFIWGRQQERQV